MISWMKKEHQIANYFLAPLNLPQSWTLRTDRSMLMSDKEFQYLRKLQVYNLRISEQ